MSENTMGCIVDASQWLKMLSELLGGLGLFLFGMKLMSDGLQKSAGKGLRTILEKLTSNRFVGAFVGVVVTAIIQSSSATTVMTVGFVNAGLMNLTQALSVVLGANVGTTVTAQLIAFKISAIASPAVGIGTMMKLFSKKPSKQYLGEILIGFGLIFLGMSAMKHGFKPLSHDQDFVNLFVYFGKNPIMAAAAGAILTMIVQSSSATIGITIALASTGLLDFYGASALVLGENIGTTITANLAALGSNRTAKQAAFGHFLINLIGVAYMLIFLKVLIHFVDGFTPGDANFVTADGVRPYIDRHIANLHTTFNIINMVIFLPLLHVLAKICEKIIKTGDVKYKLVRLNDALLKTPSIAVAQARKEVARVSLVPLEMLRMLREAFLNRDEELFRKIIQDENLVDKYEKEINDFLFKVSQQNLSQRSVMLISNMQHVLHNLEKIADHIENISVATEKMFNKKIELSDDAVKEACDMFDVAIRFCENVLKVYNGQEEQAYVPTEDEDVIDAMRKRYRKNHVKRLNSGSCSIDAGLIFVDILNNLERVGDHTFNIAQVIIGAEETKAYLSSSREI